MILDNSRYYDTDIVCSTCGKIYNPSKEIKILEILEVPPLYANIFCSRKCAENYSEFLASKQQNKMTPTQLRETGTIELIEILKAKGRCIHSESIAKKVLNELKNRLGGDIMWDIELGMKHLQSCEGDKEFNDTCNNLINTIKNLKHGT
jgi:hypothetical protein